MSFCSSSRQPIMPFCASTQHPTMPSSSTTRQPIMPSSLSEIVSCFPAMHFIALYYILLYLLVANLSCRKPSQGAHRQTTQVPCDHAAKCKAAQVLGDHFIPHQARDPSWSLGVIHYISYMI